MDGIIKYDIDGRDITEEENSGNEVACASPCYAWKDMSTAPKDGTEIMALYKDNGEYHILWMEAGERR